MVIMQKKSFVEYLNIVEVIKLNYNCKNFNEYKWSKYL